MKVLITTDGSECSYEAIRQFIQLTHDTLHSITILYVMPMLTIGRDIEYIETEQEREGINALNTARAILSRSSISAKSEILQGIPSEAILEFARKGDFNLIVMGKKGKGGFREYMLGSVSKHIVQNAPCSIFIGMD